MSHTALDANRIHIHNFEYIFRAYDCKGAPMSPAVVFVPAVPISLEYILSPFFKPRGLLLSLVLLETWSFCHSKFLFISSVDAGISVCCTENHLC